MSDVIDKNTEEKKLGRSNPSIKVHIPYSLVLLNLSTLNSTKPKLTLSPVLSMLDPTKHDSQNFLNQIKPEKNQNLASLFPNN